MAITLSSPTSRLEYPGSISEVKYRATSQENEALLNTMQQRNQLLIQGMNILEQRKVENLKKLDAIGDTLNSINVDSKFKDSVANEVSGLKGKIDDVLNSGDIYSTGSFIHNLSNEVKSNLVLKNSVLLTNAIREVDKEIHDMQNVDPIFKDKYFKIDRDNILNNMIQSVADTPKEQQAVSSPIDLVNTHLNIPKQIDIFGKLMQRAQSFNPNITETLVKDIFESDDKAKLMKKLNISDEFNLATQRTTTYKGLEEALLRFGTDPNTELGQYVANLAEAKSQLTNKEVTPEDIVKSYVTGLDRSSVQTAIPDWTSYGLSLMKASREQAAKGKVYIASQGEPFVYSKENGLPATKSEYDIRQNNLKGEIFTKVSTLTLTQDNKDLINSTIANDDFIQLNRVIKSIEDKEINVSNEVLNKLEAYRDNLEIKQQVYNNTFDNGFQKILNTPINGKSIQDYANVFSTPVEGKVDKETFSKLVKLLDTDLQTISNTTDPDLKNLLQTDPSFIDKITDVYTHYHSQSEDDKLKIRQVLGVGYDNKQSERENIQDETKNSIGDYISQSITGIVNPIVNTVSAESFSKLRKGIIGSSQYVDYLDNYDENFKQQTITQEMAQMYRFDETTRNNNAAQWIHHATQLRKGNEDDYTTSYGILKASELVDPNQKAYKNRKIDYPNNPNDVQFEGVTVMNGDVYYGYKVKKLDKVQPELYFIQVDPQELEFANLSTTSDMSNKYTKVVMGRYFDNITSHHQLWDISQDYSDLPFTLQTRKVGSNVYYELTNNETGSVVKTQSLPELTNNFVNNFGEYLN